MDAQAVGQVEAGEHGDSVAIDVSRRWAISVIKFVDRMGQRLHFAGFIGGDQRIGLVEDGDANGSSVPARSPCGALRSVTIPGLRA